MKITVGLCDDCCEQVELLAGYIKRYSEARDIEIFYSTEPEVFLSQIEERKPQLLFLDIDMERMNGIELGEKIRESLKDAVIIYITGYEKYALEAFRIRAFHYLIKPMNRESFLQVFEEACDLIEKRSRREPQKSFTLQNKGELIVINYSDIYYFEKTGHKIKIRTTDRDIFYYGNMYRLLEKLDRNQFIQCHQGYIVNMDKVRCFHERSLYLGENLKLPVSRSCVERVKELMTKQLFSGKEQV